MQPITGTDRDEQRDYYRLAARTALAASLAIANQQIALEEAVERLKRAAKEAIDAATQAHQMAALARQAVADMDRWAANALELGYKELSA